MRSSTCRLAPQRHPVCRAVRPRRPGAVRRPAAPPHRPRPRRRASVRLRRPGSRSLGVRGLRQRSSPHRAGLPGGTRGRLPRIVPRSGLCDHRLVYRAALPRSVPGRLRSQARTLSLRGRPLPGHMGGPQLREQCGRVIDNPNPRDRLVAAPLVDSRSGSRRIGAVGLSSRARPVSRSQLREQQLRGLHQQDGPFFLPGFL